MARSFLHLIRISSMLVVLSGTCLSSSALADQSNPVDSLIEEGRRLYFQGRYADAVERYRQGLAIAPQNVTALYELAWAYFELAEYPQSLEAATGATFTTSREMDRIYGLISLNYHYTMTVATYEVELNERTQDEVARFRENALAVMDGDEQLFKLGLTYMVRNDYENAVSAYNDALRLRPDYAGAHWDMGKSFDILGNHALAAMAYAQAVVSGPEGVFADRILTMLENSLIRFGGDTTTVHTTPQGSPAMLAEDLKRIVMKIESRTASDSIGIGRYLPWYRRMIDDGHLETFARYVYHIAGDAKAGQWIEANRNRLNSYLEWSRGSTWAGTIERKMEE